MSSFFRRLIPYKIKNILKRVLIYFPFERASSNNGEILEIDHIRYKQREKLCIFSHFDKDDLIDRYVVYYIESLYNEEFDIIFVSTSTNLLKSERKKIEPFCKDIIIKENIGYDFGAWATAINYFQDELNLYKQLLLCNDSVYAPLFSLNKIFNDMNGKYDFWGITDSYEIDYHIQSYFMVFDNKILKDKYFQDIWKNYKVFRKKRNIILNYELGLSRILLENNFTIGAYIPYKDIDTKIIKNPTQYHWKELIHEFRSPILKIELLRDNPKNIDIANWEDYIEQKTDYDTTMIKTHLKRVKSI